MLATVVLGRDRVRTWLGAYRCSIIIGVVDGPQRVVREDGPREGIRYVVVSCVSASCALGDMLIASEFLLLVLDPRRGGVPPNRYGLGSINFSGRNRVRIELAALALTELVIDGVIRIPDGSQRLAPGHATVEVLDNVIHSVNPLLGAIATRLESEAIRNLGRTMRDLAREGPDVWAYAIRELQNLGAVKEVAAANGGDRKPELSPAGSDIRSSTRARLLEITEPSPIPSAGTPPSSLPSAVRVSSAYCGTTTLMSPRCVASPATEPGTPLSIQASPRYSTL